MKNKENFAKEILHIACKGYPFSVTKSGEITFCDCFKCDMCKFYVPADYKSCRIRRYEWSELEYVEKHTVSKFSTYDVVYANDTLRSIFSAALGDLYEKYKSICNQDATDSIIAPLVEKYGDKSNGGMVTYRKVYKKMGEMSPINWHNLEVRYINKHGKAGARRKKIISSNPEMLRKFKNAVDVMMVG